MVLAWWPPGAAANTTMLADPVHDAAQVSIRHWLRRVALKGLRVL